MIEYKILVFDRNSCNHTTVYNLFVLDKNTWYKKKTL